MNGFPNELPGEGEVNYLPSFFSKAESDHFFRLLIMEIAWKQEPIKIFGKTVMQPRLTAWYGDPGKTYSYSGITMKALDWTQSLLIIKQRIETVAPAVFNSALLNQYRNNLDSMGWHRDNEKELGPDPVIGSVSFGASRIFQFRHYLDKKVMISRELTHGSLLLMHGQTQHSWEHRVAKQGKEAGARINLTFRVIRD